MAASQPQNGAAASATQPAAASNSQSGQPAAAAIQTAQPAAMSGFTAQAVLECHYSHNGAFLQEPLLQVGALQQQMCACIVPGRQQLL